MRTIFLAVLTLALSGAVPAAQAPKIGATYLDDTSLGFSVSVGPEPASLSLLAAGALGLLRRGRRRSTLA